MDNPKTHTLRRDGKRSLRFEGELLAECSSKSHTGPNQNRWTEIDIYQTKAGKHVVQIVRRTCWQGEHDTYQAELCEEPEDVYRFLVDAEDGLLTDLAKQALKEAGLDDLTFETVE
ncbi:MAG: hypothetical protein JXR96_04905 [Deltaproteobacteria bacterium]|nr:hypothetical protein [Deltaproteobacteria bacterium]